MGNDWLVMFIANKIPGFFFSVISQGLPLPTCLWQSGKEKNGVWRETKKWTVCSGYGVMSQSHVIPFPFLLSLLQICIWMNAYNLLCGPRCCYLLRTMEQFALDDTLHSTFPPIMPILNQCCGESTFNRVGSYKMLLCTWSQKIHSQMGALMRCHASSTKV